MSTYYFGVLLWAGFLISWQLASFWRSRARIQTSVASRLRDVLFYVVGFVFLFTPRANVAGLWENPPIFDYGILALEVGGFLFAWLARIYLGRLWSDMITVSADHRIVQTGPYGLVRHPIYTGFLLSAWSIAFLVASPTAFIGAAILSAQMVWKAKREEDFLSRELDRASYAEYAARTPMLVPFIPNRKSS